MSIKEKFLTILWVLSIVSTLRKNKEYSRVSLDSRSIGSCLVYYYLREILSLRGCVLSFFAFGLPYFGVSVRYIRVWYLEDSSRTIDHLSTIEKSESQSLKERLRVENIDWESEECLLSLDHLTLSFLISKSLYYLFNVFFNESFIIS